MRNKIQRIDKIRILSVDLNCVSLVIQKWSKERDPDHRYQTPDNDGQL